MSDSEKPHPQNVEGPFYVLDGCCTACGVPETVAPELFAYDSATHCYVKRQPTTPAEIEHALHVIRGQELGCVRYRGADAVILHRLAEAGESASCDHPIEGVEPVLRNVVTFSVKDSEVVTLAEFVGFYNRVWPWSSLRVKRPTASFWSRSLSRRPPDESLAISWFQDRFHELMLSHVANDSNGWRIRHAGPLAISESLDRWLSETPRYDEISWYTEADWRSGLPGQRRPW